VSATLRLPLADVPERVPTRVEVDGHPVCLVRTGHTVRAVDDTCTHAEVSLSEGELDGRTVECWLHGSRFDLDTGAPTGPPAVIPLTVHHAEVEDATVVVRLSRSLHTDDRTDERNAS
jgi:3-phenylpropionate/trans-cinnamate dioxygenase ferredoxin subunit